MPQCPYPEDFKDQVSGKTETNRLYLAWHEGYEAHKFEMANQSIILANLLQEFDTEVRNVKEMERELQRQRVKFEETK